VIVRRLVPVALQRLLAVIAVAWCIAAPSRVEAKLTPPKLDGFIVDTSGTLSADARRGIDDQLSSFQAETGYSIVVFVTRSLEDDSLEDAAYTVFNTWKVGDARKDNGILLLVAPTERKIRIETGKGAGGAVTDLQANDIIKQMSPLMEQSRVDYAVQLAIVELEVLVRKDLGLDRPAAGPATRKSSKVSNTIPLIILFVVVALFAVLAVTQARKRARRRSAMGNVDTAVSAFQVIGGIARVLSAIAGGKGGSSSKGRRRSGGGGGRSGGGGSSGGY
jgi:uncharacterized protein